MHACIDIRGAKLYAGTGIGTYTMRLMENIQAIDSDNHYSFFWPNGGYESFATKKNIQVILLARETKSFGMSVICPKD